jgi:hypothetical protein
MFTMSARFSHDPSDGGSAAMGGRKFVGRLAGLTGHDSHIVIEAARHGSML